VLFAVAELLVLSTDVFVKATLRKGKSPNMGTAPITGTPLRWDSKEIY